MNKRRWEVIIFPFWEFHIYRPFGGKYGPVFLRETWIGPFCFRLWSDPRSVGDMSRAVYKARSYSSTTIETLKELERENPWEGIVAGYEEAQT